jgi:hypothetical protein
MDARGELLKPGPHLHDEILSRLQDVLLVVRFVRLEPGFIVVLPQLFEKCTPSKKMRSLGLRLILPDIIEFYRTTLIWFLFNLIYI